MTIQLSKQKRFARLLPELTKEEHRALEESLQKEGCRDPIVTWHGTVIDGHHRYSICKKHNIPFNINEKDDLLDEEAVQMWIINNQFCRRNLTDEQRERFIGIIHNASKKERGGARDNAGRKSKTQNEPLKNISNKDAGTSTDTAGLIAKQHGISRETVKRAGKYATALDRIGKVSPTAEAKIMRGEAKVNKGNIRNLADASDAEVEKIVKAIEKDELVKKTKATNREPQVQQVYKIINELENRTDYFADLVGKLVGQLTDKDRAKIGNHVDNLSTKMQLIWQSFL